jgi:hypothetical protein
VNDQMPTPPAAEPQQTLFGSPVYGSHSYGMPPQAAGPSKAGLARWLVILAGFGIVARALVMVACGNRISFADNLLNGGTASLDDANQADHLVTAAGVVSAVAFLAFLGVLIAVRSRGKKGDPLYAAVSRNPRVRVFSRVYLVAVVLSIFLSNAFKKDDSASAQDQIHGVIHGDWASIGINALVIAFLGVLVVVTRSEIAKARAAGTAA